MSRNVSAHTQRPDMHLTDDIAIPCELVEAHRRGELVIFAGAGVSMDEPANLPSFKGLARGLAELAEVPFCEGHVNGESCVASQASQGAEATAESQEFHKCSEPREFDRFLGSFPREFDLRRHALKLVSPPEAKPNTTHQAIMRLAQAGGIPRIVTTNYDTLLSAVASEGQIETKRWDAPSLPEGDSFRGIVHLHGSAKSDPNDIVLTDEDFGNAYLSNGWATRFLVPMFRWYTVLFIGYSLGDLIMRYLRRGMSSDNRCFALVPKEVAARPEWERLGVDAIGYPVGEDSEGMRDHSALVGLLEEWTEFAKATPEKQKERVSKIVRCGPEDLGKADRDFLFSQLEDCEGAKSFTSACCGLGATDSWAWLKWVAENLLDFQAAFKGKTSSEPTEELLEWYCSSFIAKPELQGAALNIALKYGQEFNDVLLKSAASTVLNFGEEDPQAGNRWKAVLLSSFRRRIVDRHTFPVPYSPGQQNESLMVLAEMMRPRLVLKQSWSLIDDRELPGLPFCDLDWDVDKESLRTHLLAAVEQSPPADAQLGLILENALMQCYQLFFAYQGDLKSDPPSARRTAIEEHIRDKSGGTLNVIIDALRDYGLRAQDKGGVDFSERWMAMEGQLFHRLAIHLVRHSTRSEDEKISWLVDHVDLRSFEYKHEVYCLLKETLRGAKDETKECLLEMARIKTADYQEVLRYAINNPLSWFVQCDANWKEASDELKAFRKEFPGLPEPEHHDCGIWVESDGVGRQTVMSKKEFLERLDANCQDLLEELLSYPDRKFDELNWEDVCEFIQEISKTCPVVGVQILDFCSEMKDDYAKRSTDLLRSIVTGWTETKLDHVQDNALRAVRDLIDGADDSSLYAVTRFLFEQQKRGCENDSIAASNQLLEELQEIARYLGETYAQSYVPPTNCKGTDLLSLGFNSWPGELAEYWVAELKRKATNECCGALSTEKKQLDLLLHNDGTCVAALPVLARKLSQLFEALPEWTSKNLIPLFGKKDMLFHTWRPYLRSCDWTPALLQAGLLPAVKGAWDWIDAFEDQWDQSEFVSLVISLLFSDGLELKDKLPLLSRSVLAGSGKYRLFFAREMRDQLARSSVDEVARTWDEWLKKHVERRLDGLPRNASSEEVSAWADIVPFLGDRTGEALNLFKGKDVSLLGEDVLEEVPAGLPSEYVGKFASFYARRIEIARPVFDIFKLSSFRRMVNEFEETYGDDVVKSIRDACVKAGIPL